MRQILQLTILLFPFSTLAQTGERWYYNINTDNVALKGYDPVSYFASDGASPKPGEQSIHYSYKGVIYQFVSEANLNKFKASPERYLPKYGGWCAYRLAQKAEEEGWGQSRTPGNPTKELGIRAQSGQPLEQQRLFSLLARKGGA